MKRLLPLCLLLGGCALMPSAPRPVTGEWGGPHIALHLTAAGGTIDYDCAEGTIGPVLPGRDGAFVAKGNHSPRHGGPLKAGESPPRYPAEYSGTITGNAMVLSGIISNGPSLGPFTLTRGAQASLFRCL